MHVRFQTTRGRVSAWLLPGYRAKLRIQLLFWIYCSALGPTHSQYSVQTQINYTPNLCLTSKKKIFPRISLLLLGTPIWSPTRIHIQPESGSLFRIHNFYPQCPNSNFYPNTKSWVHPLHLSCSGFHPVPARTRPVSYFFSGVTNCLGLDGPW